MPDIKSPENCLINNNNNNQPSFDVVSLYIFYELDRWSRDLDTDRLFGSVKWTKNADPDKYKYSGYGMGFDSHPEFSLPDGSYGENAIIFGVDMSSSVYADNKGKDILILGKGPNTRVRWYYINSRS